jgi:hypothetical protein
MNQEIPYQHQLVYSHSYKNKSNTTRYVPVEDGFVSSANNSALAAKYGNKLGDSTITTQELIHSITITDIKK